MFTFLVCGRPTSRWGEIWKANQEMLLDRGLDQKKLKKHKHQISLLCLLYVYPFCLLYLYVARNFMSRNPKWKSVELLDQLLQALGQASHCWQNTLKQFTKQKQYSDWFSLLSTCRHYFSHLFVITQLHNHRIWTSFHTFLAYFLKHKLLQRCNQCEYASSHLVNIKWHLKTHRGEKSHKYLLVVQISIPSVLHQDVKLNSSLKTFWKCTNRKLSWKPRTKCKCWKNLLDPCQTRSS